MVKRDDVHICPECGAKVVEYTHGLNKVLANGLRKLYSAGGRAKLKEVDMPLNEITNFQKLKYWGLVFKSKKGSIWELTEKGLKFLRGEYRIPRFVKTYRGEPTWMSDEKIFIYEITDYVHDREFFKSKIKE